MPKPIKKKFTKAAKPTPKALGKKLLVAIWELVHVETCNGSAAEILKSAKRVLKLIAQGADVNVPGKNTGWPALYVAVWRQNDKVYADIARALIAHGADINYKVGELSGVTALMNAAQGGCTDIVNLLLQANADMDVRDKSFGHTALHKAVEAGYCDIAAMLVAKGASLDVQDNNGDTALALAAQYAHLDPEFERCARLLIDAGADPGRKNNDGKTAYDYALENDNPGLVEAAQTAAMKKIEDDIRGGLKHALPPITPLSLTRGQKCPHP